MNDSVPATPMVRATGGIPWTPNFLALQEDVPPYSFCAAKGCALSSGLSRPHEVSSTKQRGHSLPAMHAALYSHGILETSPAPYSGDFDLGAGLAS